MTAHSLALGTPYRSAVPAGRNGPSLRPSRTAALTLARSRRSSGGSTIAASWISASIVSGLSSGFSAHSHHRSKASLLSFMQLLRITRFGHRLLEQVQRTVDLLQEALNFLAFVRTGTFLQSF